MNFITTPLGAIKYDDIEKLTLRELLKVADFLESKEHRGYTAIFLGEVRRNINAKRKGRNSKDRRLDDYIIDLAKDFFTKAEWQEIIKEAKEIKEKNDSIY